MRGASVISRISNRPETAATADPIGRLEDDSIVAMLPFVSPAFDRYAPTSDTILQSIDPGRVRGPSESIAILQSPIAQSDNSACFEL